MIDLKELQKIGSQAVSEKGLNGYSLCVFQNSAFPSQNLYFFQFMPNQVFIIEFGLEIPEGSSDDWIREQVSFQIRKHPHCPKGI